VESLGGPVDQRSSAVHRPMLLVSSTRLVFVLLSQTRLFDGQSAFRVNKSDRTLVDPLTPAFRTHDGHQTMMPPPSLQARVKGPRQSLRSTQAWPQRLDDGG
jgi:hypothetical protein